GPATYVPLGNVENAERVGIHDVAANPPVRKPANLTSRPVVTTSNHGLVLDRHTDPVHNDIPREITEQQNVIARGHVLIHRAGLIGGTTQQLGRGRYSQVDRKS